MEARKVRKFPRQRKKKLIIEVKDLLEFYFSPANIVKDKFMQNLLKKDSNVNLEIFLKFNKIKALTNEIKFLQKAVNLSNILLLSEDKLRVKRIEPFKIKANEIDCTIYVENLPPNSTREWLQKIFSIYGEIDYISLPRFQQSGHTKGFAFIEFHTPQEANKALESFGGLASFYGTLNQSRQVSCTEENDDHHYELSFNKEEQQENESLHCKKRSAAKAFLENKNDQSKNNTLKKLKAADEQNDTEIRKQKKKRKRMKKERKYEPNSVYLRVMSKRHWKYLKNKYLNIQKENMKKLKYSLNYTHNDISFNKNIHNDMFILGKRTKPKFTSGVIAKIILNEPPQNLKELKDSLTTGSHSIAYVEICLESLEVYVRFVYPEHCKQFCSEGLWKKVTILEGEEEQIYWEKIFSSWDGKHCSRKKDVFMQRGRFKLFTKALKKSTTFSNSM